MTRLLPAFLLFVLSPVGHATEVPLGPGPHRDLQIQAEPDTVFQVTLGKGNPHFWTTVVPASYQVDQQTVFALEYFAPVGLDAVVLRYRVSDGSMAVAESRPLPLSETWQPLAFDLSGLDPRPAAGHPEMRFHLELRGGTGTRIGFRRMMLREAKAEEKRLATNRELVRTSREAEGAVILSDLRSPFAEHIETVQVGEREITLTGKATAPMKLIGIPPECRSDAASRKQAVAEAAPEASGHFVLKVPRIEPSGLRDRALWRWRLCDATGHWTSAARWPSHWDPGVARPLPRLSAPHQKGLGGIPSLSRPDHEIFDLGIRHATMNVVIQTLIRDTPATGWTPWLFEGRTFFLNEKLLQSHDRTLRLLTSREIIVSVILLVGNGRDAAGKPHSLLTHPEADARGVYSMPNLTGEDPARLYGAALHLLAERWSRIDGSCGRVSNWILHNEIDQGATWTNMGAQPLARYLETYLRSARLMYHTARLFDPGARVFISLTHHWTQKSSGSGTYVVRDLLDLFAEMARAEGDFEWGVAYHPYPKDLRNPDAWKDPGLSDDFNTPYITPKNIAVLPAYLAQPAFLYHGTPRAILLSEQGFNTPTLSPEDQLRQVAGLIYVFRQIRPLKTIEAFQMHRYQDMPLQEGGLRLGIVTENGDHKLGWEAYRAIGTDREDGFGKIVDDLMKQGKP